MFVIPLFTSICSQFLTAAWNGFQCCHVLAGRNFSNHHCINISWSDLLCLSVTLQEIPIDCCLDVANKQIDKSVVVDYREQKRGEGCAIDAMM